MLTFQTNLADTPTDEEVADWTQRREALRIRPLIEFPALRAAMGLTDFPTPVATSKSSKRQPKSASAPATNTRTNSRSKNAERARRVAAGR